MAKLVEKKPSRGFGKCWQLLEKTDPHWNPKRIYRVYCAMRLNLRRAAKRRLPRRERVPLYVPEQPDTVWSADAMLDALACGRALRTFNITDDFNREIIRIEVDTSITSLRLVRIFERIRQERPLLDVCEAAWRFLIDYNDRRPHDALGGMTPAEYRNHPESGGLTFELSA